MSNPVVHFWEFWNDCGECRSKTLIGSAIVPMAAAIVTIANVVIASLSRGNRGRSRCRGRSHQTAITKLPSLSRSSRGRSRCRGRSHQTAITKLAAAIVVVAVGVV